MKRSQVLVNETCVVCQEMTLVDILARVCWWLKISDEEITP